MPTTADIPATATCWLRVEGVNHSHFIFDTNDLSTIRGGGMLLLEAIDKVKERIQRTWPGSQTISSGASTGLFKVPGANPAQLLAEVRKCLGTGDFSCASFVVAAIPVSGEFERDRETLIAMNRHEQMTMPSLQMPDPSESNKGVCAVDRISPAVCEGVVKKKNANLSASVYARRETGKDRKQSYYKKQLKLPVFETINFKHRFAKEFSEIAEANRNPNNNTEGKIAVFYADGNSFGTFQRTQEPEALSRWDKDIRAKRLALLNQLIQPYLEYDTKKGDKQIIPFETLLWGGDEMLFVVPADTGLELAQHFFAATQNWQFTNEQGDNMALSHAVGLVFCHSNAPINRIKKLAEALANQAKTDSGRTNALNIAVLKSFDHTGGEWADYIKRQYKGSIFTANLWLDPVRYEKLLGDIAFFKQHHLPRGRLHDYLHATIHGTSLTGQDPQYLEKRLLHDLDDATKERVKPYLSRTDTDTDTATATATATDLAWWSQVCELWDFVTLPETTAPDTTQGQTANHTEGATA